MDLVITLEHRFDRTPDGAIWTQTMFAQHFWQRYLAVFDHVRVVARVRDVASVPLDWQPADGANISFARVPYYLGPWQYLWRRRQVQRAVEQAFDPSHAIILRVGSQLAACMQASLRRTGHPYAVEVVGDPYDVFAPGSIRHPLRPFFRWWFSRQLRQQCRGACAAAYVTEHALQRRYPAAANTLMAGFSDVELSDAAFKVTAYYSSIDLPQSAIVAAPRYAQPKMPPYSLITVATLAQLYKAPDVLIDAVAACVREGLDLRLVLIGDGKHRPELAARAARLGLQERVTFLGQLPAGAAIRAQLDQADLFVLPSYQEGLPRAMIEAMARALPCIGSNVGGIPELLSAENMVLPGDVTALANKIREVVTDPQRMEQMSIRNLEKAKEYREDILHARRVAFYHQVREKTEAWLKTPTT